MATRKRRGKRDTCVDCIKNLTPNDPISRCPKCAKLAIARSRVRRQKLIAQHRCESCGNELPEGYSYTRCRKCLDKQNIAKNKYRSYQKDLLRTS